MSTTFGKISRVVLVALSIVKHLSLAAQPVVTPGLPPNTVRGVISARWKGLNNVNNTNTALYIGNSNIGAGGPNRSERNGAIYFRPGNNTVSFTYDAANDRLFGSINGNTINYTNLSSRLISGASLCRMNYMTLNVRNSAAGSVSFTNVTLDGQPVGPFSITGGQNLTWNIQNYDFSAGFTLSGTIVLGTGAYSGNESSKVELMVGEMNPLTAIASTTACPGSPSSITLSGLLPGKAYTVNYDIEGVSQSASFTSNASGSASFTTPVLVAADFGKILQVNSLAVSGGCTWTATAANATTLTQAVCATLPVSGFELRVNRTGDFVQLDWYTATETNTSHFEIERSRDGLSWERVGQVRAAGTSLQQRQYRFIDQDPLQGNSLYRLRKVDLDGRHSYSLTGRVTMKQQAGPVIAGPVPFSSHLYVSGKDMVRCRLLSAEGVLLEEVVVTAGSIGIETARFRPGIYILQTVMKDGSVAVRKLVKN